MRDARSQLAQRRHLFNLRELLANAFLLFDVVIEFRDVSLGFLGVGRNFFGFCGRRHEFDVPQVRSIG